MSCDLVPVFAEDTATAISQGDCADYIYTVQRWQYIYMCVYIIYILTMEIMTAVHIFKK